MEAVELKAHIQNRMKVLMAEEGYRSIQALASETGISANTLYNVVHGKNTNLSLENICKLLWALDCSFEDLFQFEIESNEPVEYESLADDVQQAIQEGRSEQREAMKKAKKPREGNGVKKELRIKLGKRIFTAIPQREYA